MLSACSGTSSLKSYYSRTLSDLFQKPAGFLIPRLFAAADLAEDIFNNFVGVFILYPVAVSFHGLVKIIRAVFIGYLFAVFIQGAFGGADIFLAAVKLCIGFLFFSDSMFSLESMIFVGKVAFAGGFQLLFDQIGKGRVFSQFFTQRLYLFKL